MVYAGVDRRGYQILVAGSQLDICCADGRSVFVEKPGAGDSLVLERLFGTARLGGGRILCQLVRNSFTQHIGEFLKVNLVQRRDRVSPRKYNDQPKFDGLVESISRSCLEQQ